MMITVTQTRREITVRSARLDYVEIDKRVATMPALDTTMPAVPTDTKAPSTKLFAAQLAALSAGQFTDEATEGPFARKVWQMYVYNGIPMLREVVALALLLTLSALAGDRESIVVDSVSRETAQEVHFTGTVLVPTPTATSQVANAIYVQQQAAAAESAAKAAVSAHDGAADPHHGKFDLAGTATAAAAAAESAAKAASDPAGTSAAVESALKSRLSSIDIRLFQEIFLTATHIAAGTEYGPAGFFDCFTTDSVATKTNAYYDSSLKLYDSLTPGTFDLCIGGTANSSSGVAEANKAFDDNISTSCGFPEWITYTFSTGVTAYSYSVNNNNTRPIKTLTLSGSNNGSTWTTLHTITAIQSINTPID